MKKNNITFSGKKFLYPQIGYYMVCCDNVEITWKKDSFETVEAFSFGKIAFVTDVYRQPSGNKVIKVLCEEKTLEIPYTLKKYFYFVKPNNSLANKNFCITGRLKYHRSFYETFINFFGASYKENISDNVDYLISNASEKTQKINKAKCRNIKIINENAFWQLLESQKM